ncbi:MAG: OB-fold nucleic acid binding domain-containing protein, partial [Clostridia bacterium]
PMMFITISDVYGSIETVLFPKLYTQYFKLVEVNNIVKITGKVSMKENEKGKILLDSVTKISKDIKIYINVLDKTKENEITNKIKEISNEFYGEIPVYLFFKETKKMKLLNRENWLDSSTYVIDKLSSEFGMDNVKKK